MTNPVDDHTPPQPPPPGTVIPFPDQPALPPLPDEDPYLTQLDHQPPPTTGQRRIDTTAPHNPAAERAVLGALIADAERLPDVRPILKPDDFYVPHHEELYNLLINLADQGTPIDAMTVGDHLLRSGTLTTPAWRGFNLGDLVLLQQACPVTANAAAYAETVRDYGRLRRAGSAAARLTQIVRDADIDSLEETLLDGIDLLDQAYRADGDHPTGPNTTGLHDLTWILTGEAPQVPPPTYTHRTDGHALFYAGAVNGVFGDPESGKTWLAQTAIVEALNNGDTAAMIDVDHNGPNHTTARLLLLGARIEHLADPARFRYYEPEDNDQLLAAVDDITAWRPGVYVLDSLGEVLPMMGVKSVDNDEITAALRRTCSPPATAGSCVITIDHLPKNPDSRQSGYAIGGTAKKRMMRGSYLRVEVRTQPAPGQIGRATIRIEKDTLGELRKVTPGGYAGTFILDSTADHITRWSIDRDTAPVDAKTGTFRPTSVMESISKYVEDNDLCTFTAIKVGVSAKDTTLRAAIKLLINEGFMTTVAGPKNSTRHHVVAHYREAEDDHRETDQ